VTRGFAVATSGGRDSTALLHAALAAARALDLRVHALHVHHGLLADADRWLEHVRRQCTRWASAGAPVHFHGHRLLESPGPGASVEAWARRARYSALAAMARDCGVDLVLLAHHRQDQAETFLLQALRGGGPAGLAAMPREVRRNGITWARPWLDMPRVVIEAYVRHHRLRFVDDPSNTEPRFARGRLRSQVWPALEIAFPEAEGALATAARHAHEAMLVIEEIAAADLATVRDGESLRVPAWQALSPARRQVVLRLWLRERGGRGASDTLVRRLMDELPDSGPARWPLHAGAELRLYRGRLDVASPAVGEGAPLPATTLHVSGPGVYELPEWGGALCVKVTGEGGIALELLHRCELRPRKGSEQFQAAANRPARSLKKQFQAAGIAPWQRCAPLLYCDGRLVFVPGLGIDASALAWPGQPRVHLEWLSEGPLLLHRNR
jgi:tRNA(Ile)-lysidine synthase